jgi:beta-lactamase superfamily II metal-dependent hydrolase
MTPLCPAESPYPGLFPYSTTRAKLTAIAAAITIDVLPAAYGDAIWIECARDGRPWRMVVDGGPPEAAGALEARLDGLPPGDRVLDVVVVSHIDSDHIGGMLPLLAREDIDVGDVWFNALPQLPAQDEPATRSVHEGEDLVGLLTGVSRSRPLPWNRVVDGHAVATSGDRTFRELAPAGGPRITLLSPTPKRLLALRRVWEHALERVQRGESEELEPPTPSEPLGDLVALAATESTNDASVPNGSSIAFLLEHRGASFLLGADAFPTVLGGALWALANARGGRPVAVDAVKLPHHGSQHNVSAKLLTVVSSKQFLISTSGEKFDHPDDVSLARAATAGGPGTTLWFNYPATAKTHHWADPKLGDRYELTTRFADPGGGTRVELTERT